MADITKCANGQSCPKSETCYRHTAPDSEYKQAWDNFHPDKPWLCFYYRKSTDVTSVNDFNRLEK